MWQVQRSAGRWADMPWLQRAPGFGARRGRHARRRARRHRRLRRPRLRCRRFEPARVSTNRPAAANGGERRTTRGGRRDPGGRGRERAAQLEAARRPEDCRGPRRRRPGLHALGVRRGPEGEAERVPARSSAEARKPPTTAPRSGCPPRTTPPAGREVGGRACMRLACTEDSKT